jgi:8-oxo-dGTP diphosphatase
VETEPKHTVVVACLVRNGSGNILLIRSPGRGWELPQGRVEEGEDLLEALRREVREETGVEVDPGPLAAVYSQVSPMPAIVFTFLGTYLSGSLATSEESLDVEWFPPEEGLRLVTHPVNLERLSTLLDFRGKTVYKSYACKPYRILGESFLNRDR